MNHLLKTSIAMAARRPGHASWPPVAPVLLALVAGSTVAGLGACKHDSDERLGLDEKKARPDWDKSSLSDTGELEKAVQVSAVEVDRKLGAHRLEQTAKLQLSAGDRKDSLEEHWRYEVDASGNLRMVHDNSHDYGFETLAVGGQLYIKPVQGRYVRRSPEGNEVLRLRDEQAHVLSGWLSVLGRFATRKDVGALTHAGRAAHKVVLGLDGSPDRASDPEAQRAYRKGIKVSALTGEIVVDDETGLPLHAVLDATYTVPRTKDAWAAPTEANEKAAAAASPEIQLTLAYRAEVEELGKLAPIAAPADAVPGTGRARPLLDKQFLLDGLVAPSGGK